MTIPASYWCLYKTHGLNNVNGEAKAVRMAEQFPDLIVFQAELIAPVDSEFVLKIQADVRGLEERLSESFMSKKDDLSILMPYETDSTKPVPWWKRRPSWL